MYRGVELNRADQCYRLGRLEVAVYRGKKMLHVDRDVHEDIQSFDLCDAHWYETRMCIVNE